MNSKIVLPGGSGFLGQSLARVFAREGWEVVILSRKAASSQGAIRTVLWDGRTAGGWCGEFEGASAVINLTGRSVACLYTPDAKREIFESRIESVKVVEEALARCKTPPPVLIQSSSLAIYGDPGDRICSETAPRDRDFPADVVEAWEDTFFSGKGAPASRRIALRIGFVLGADGGALGPLAWLVRRFLGGAVGTGRQYVSWIHIDDFCEVCRWAIESPQAKGVYNVTGPVPVTNREFMRSLRHALHRPWSPPAPTWAVRWGAVHVMKADPSLALGGRRCTPNRLLSEGFDFQHPELTEALASLFPQKKV